MKPPRTSSPRYSPCDEVLRLRGAGWTLVAIARAVSVTLREVYRWSAGDSRPRSTHLAALRALPAVPPRPSRRIFRVREPQEERGNATEVLYGEGSR